MRQHRVGVTWAAAVVLALVVFAVVWRLPVVPGYDAAFALAWGRDVVAGLGLNFSHPSSPTPHPLSLLGAVLVSFAPADTAAGVLVAFTACAAVMLIALLGALTWELTSNRIAVAATVAMTASCAPLVLLMLNAGSDVTYCALGVAAVWLTVRARYRWAIGAFLMAALLRPEAVLFALVPLMYSYRARGTSDAGSAKSRTWRVDVTVFTIGTVAAAGTWLMIGAAGGDPFVALHSAATNADVNHNPQGITTAITTLMPSLAAATGWVTIAATAAVVSWAMVARRRNTQRTHSSRAPDRERTLRGIVGVAWFVAVGSAAYLAQGLLGTPLVARYVLLPALLCVSLASVAIALASRRVRSRTAATTISAVVAAALVGAAVFASVDDFHDVTHARQVRVDAFSAAREMLDTELARNCTADVVLRSPAMVAVTALMLERPLSDVMVAGQAGDGVLLQPLTQDAADLAGYGPVTPLVEQAVFPSDAPPRHSNEHWALYSRCQP